MEVHEYEKALLGIIMKYPNGKRNIPQRIVSELETDRLGNKHHRMIYNAIKKLVLEKETPNTINVSLALKDDCESCGGIEYLESLSKFPKLVGTTDTDFGRWLRTIDGAGRLRHLGSVVDHYKKKYEDFEKLVATVGDVDAFLSNFMVEVNEGIAATRTTYKPIKEAVEEERRYARVEGDGDVSDIIPCGFPSLEKYMIPRPCSFGAILALSSVGKTSLGLMMAIGVAKNLVEGVVSINSLETPARRLARTMGCILSGTNSMHLGAGKLSKKQFNRYMEQLDYLETLPIRYDDNPDVTTDQLSWQAIALHITEKRVLGVSDYAELFKDKASSEELRVSQIVRNHRRIAWRVGSCEILLSQASNPHPATKMVSLSDARYTKALEQALDWGLVIYNPIQMHKRGIQFSLPENKRDDAAYIIIQKNKHYSPGEEVFNWIPEFSRFEDLALNPGQLFRVSKGQF